MLEILYLVHRFPCPPNKGDRIRTFNIIRHLSTRCKLSVATLSDEPVADHDLNTLAGHCHRLTTAPLRPWLRYATGLASMLRGNSISSGMFASAGLRQAIRSWCRQRNFDRVVLSSSSMLPYLRIAELAQTPAVVDLIDVDSQKWQDYARQAGGVRGWLYQLESHRLGAMEARPPGNVQAVTLVSREEAEIYQSLCSRHEHTGLSAAVASASPDGHSPEAHAIPNGVDLKYFSPAPASSEPDCVFVGAMDYRPNVAGVQWFCREVWPRVRRAFPESRFHIVGRNPAAQVRHLAELRGVDVTGSVPDVRPWVSRSSVVVAPLQIARGLQNKVIEAMAMAKPVVGTPEALTGLSVRPGEHVIEASSPHDFAAAIERCLADPALRQRLGSAARRYTEQHHHWSRNLAGLSRLLIPDSPAVAIKSRQITEEAATPGA